MAALSGSPRPGWPLDLSTRMPPLTPRRQNPEVNRCLDLSHLRNRRETSRQAPGRAAFCHGDHPSRPVVLLLAADEEASLVQPVSEDLQSCIFITVTGARGAFRALASFCSIYIYLCTSANMYRKKGPAHKLCTRQHESPPPPTPATRQDGRRPTRRPQRTSRPPRRRRSCSVSGRTPRTSAPASGPWACRPRRPS